MPPAGSLPAVPRAVPRAVRRPAVPRAVRRLALQMRAVWRRPRALVRSEEWQAEGRC